MAPRENRYVIICVPMAAAPRGGLGGNQETHEIIGGNKEDVHPEGCARFHLMAFCRDCISSGELRPFVERLILEDEAGKCDEVAL